MSLKDLTPKQKKFAVEYCIDMNGTQAAIRAGYAEKSASTEAVRLLANASITDYIVKHGRSITEKATITAQDVLEGLHKEATFEGEGTSHSARISAWGLLGKYHQLFSDKIDHTHKFDPSGLNDEQLEALKIGLKSGLK